MKASDEFERRVHRIHELLQECDAEVTWNDHMPDPDNPTQMRQVDITVRRGEETTFIECRKHAAAQDVNWIEELIGRRMSLRADTVVAVSSSGFTAGALRKARRYGIITRELARMTDEEVKTWGTPIDLKVGFIHYDDVQIDLLFDHASIARLDFAAVQEELKSHPAIQSLFNAAAQQLTARNHQATPFNLRIELEGFSLGGERVLEVRFRGAAQVVCQNVVCSAILSYREPELSQESEATVQTFALGETAITRDGDQVALLIDLSQLQLPPLSHVRWVDVQSEVEVEHRSMEIYGTENVSIRRGRIGINIASASVAPNEVNSS